MPVVVGVALGGALGASARYLIDRAVEQHTFSVFPWATFAINLSGCFLIGVIGQALVDRHHLPAWLARRPRPRRDRRLHDVLDVRAGEPDARRGAAHGGRGDIHGRQRRDRDRLRVPRRPHGPLFLDAVEHDDRDLAVGLLRVVVVGGHCSAACFQSRSRSSPSATRACAGKTRRAPAARPRASSRGSRTSPDAPARRPSTRRSRRRRRAFS